MISSNKHRVFLAAGGNLGDRELNLSNAWSLVVDQIGHIIRLSSVYETEPWGFASQDQFLNQTAEIETVLNPMQVLEGLLHIEHQLGRTRLGEGYTSRVIDLDLLFYDNQILNQEHLTIPHPRIHLRRFVLEPLNEIAGSFIHPEIGKSIRELLQQCADQAHVKKIGG